MTERAAEGTPRVLVVIADGSEEMEATIAVDVLRRAGVEVVVAGLDGAGPVVCSRGLRILPDCALDEADWPFELVVLPGGAEGARRFCESTDLGGAIDAHAANGGVVAAICAATTALTTHGIGRGRNLTSHPSVRDEVARVANWVDAPVVEDDDIATIPGAGTAS